MNARRLTRSTALLALMAVTTVFSSYIYAMPFHKCPFCILKREYHFIGYLLYATLLGGAVAGIGAGMLQPFRKIPSLAVIIPALQKKLALFAVFSTAAFTFTSLYYMIFTDFIL